MHPMHNLCIIKRIIRKKYSKMLSLCSFFHFTQREFRKCVTKTPQMESNMKFPLILPKMLDELFDGDQTFFFLYFFENFRHLKLRPTFHPTYKICDVG